MKHLDYALCLELKEAGFPQNPWHFGYYTVAEGSWGYSFETKEMTNYGGKNCVMMNVPNIPDPLCACPTLEELIEACGPEWPFVIELDRYGGAYSHGEWIAHLGAEDPGDGDSEAMNFWYRVRDDFDKAGAGNTPTEAVAKLWLVLNKKD